MTRFFLLLDSVSTYSVPSEALTILHWSVVWHVVQESKPEDVGLQLFGVKKLI